MLYSERETTMIQALEQLKAQKITIKQAAIMLNCSKRTVYRLKKRYEVDGVAGLLHKNKGKVSPRRITDDCLDRVRMLMKEEFVGFGPTFVQRKLKQSPYNISIGRETLRKLFHKDGYFIKKRKRLGYRSKRPRKNHYGAMWQGDGSLHLWFEDRGEKCTLILFIDDATSKIIGAQFHESESTFAVMSTLKSCFLETGLPQAIYTDKHSIYRITDQAARERGEQSSFQKACGKLGIEVIHANSPQAKGRVERVFRTLQDHLVKELRLRGISTREEANAFMATFITEHNQEYAQEPLFPENMHRSAGLYDLDSILTTDEERKLNKDWTITHNQCIYQLHKEQIMRLYPGDVITVRTYLDQSIKLFKKEKPLSFNRIIERPPLRSKKPVPQRHWPQWDTGVPPLGYKYPSSVVAKVTKLLGQKE